MAAPGEFFPQSFALGILQLAASQKQKHAELREMRSARAERNFLEQERINLSERRLAQQNEQFGDQAALQQGRLELAQSDQQFSQELAKSRFEADLQYRQKSLEQQQDGLIQKGIADFNSTGTGYVPSTGIGAVADLRKAAGDQFSIVETPTDHGVILQRVGGDDAGAAKQFAELQKIQAQTSKYNSEAALAQARMVRSEALNQKTQLESQEIAADLEDGNDVRLGEILRYQESAQKFHDQRRISIQEELDSLRFVTENNETRARRRNLETELSSHSQKNPIEFFSQHNPDIAKVFDSALQASVMASARGENRRQAGRPLQPDNRSSQAFRRPGLGDLLSKSVAQHVADGVDSKDSPITENDAHKVLPSNFQITVSQGGRAAGQAAFHIDPSNNQLIPLNKFAYGLATTDSGFRSKLHHRWRQLGWTPDKAKGETTPPPTTPTTPPSDPPTSAAPDPSAPSSEQQSAIRTRAREIIQILQSPGLDTDTVRQLRDELIQIRDTIANS